MPIRSRSSQNLFRDRLSRVYIASFHSARSNYQIFHLSKDIFFFFSTQNDEQFLENIASIFLLAEK